MTVSGVAPPDGTRTLKGVTLIDGTELRPGAEVRFGGEVRVNSGEGEVTLSGGPFTVESILVAPRDNPANAVSVTFGHPKGARDVPLGVVIRWFEQGKATLVSDWEE